jgi:TolB-like protein
LTSVLVAVTFAGVKTKKTMKHTLLQVLLLALFCLPTLAQENPDDKLAVAVLPFTASNNVKAEEVESIYGQVTESFVNSRRFTIIERKNHAAVFAELEQQKQEIYMSSTNLAKQGMQLGANFLVLGDVGAGGSNNSITVTLKLVDVETSEIVASKSISSDNTSTKKWLNTLTDVAVIGSAARTGYYTNSALAANSASKTIINSVSMNSLNIGKRVNEFIKDNFPLNSKILKIESEKGDEAETLLIAIGEGMSLKKKQELFVYEQTMLEAGGKKFRRKSLLGKLRIESIEGAVSVCKVTDGGKKILLKHTDKSVYVTTNQSK